MSLDAAAEAPLTSKRVLISGLSARPELNGTVGVAEKFVQAKHGSSGRTECAFHPVLSSRLSRPT